MNFLQQSATLEQKHPFMSKIEASQGYLEGIAVFECRVHQGVQVTWYKENEKITRQKFRYPCL